MQDLMIIRVLLVSIVEFNNVIFVPVICHLINYTLDLRDLLYWAEVQV